MTSRQPVVSEAAGSGVPSLRRLNVGEYHKMIEAGILGEDEHVQLVDGLLVAMTPQGRPHAFVIQRLTTILARSLPSEYSVLCQLPLTLGDDSEPEPDLAVVHADEARSIEHHPRSAALVIEVASDSLRFDRKTKGALYARSGIPEYWIVNLVDDCVEVYRDPDVRGRRYRTRVSITSGQQLSPESVPGLSIPASELFG